MTWPTGPPPMPPPGWYHDPERAWTWRWWDGARWTDLRAPMSVAPERDPRSFSAWFERSVACTEHVVQRMAVPLVAAWLVIAGLTWWVVMAALDSAQGRELRRLLDVDQGVFGPTGSTSATELTDDEIDRVRELVEDIVVSSIPWLVVVGLLAITVAAWTVAVVARVADRHVAAPDDPLVEDRGSVVRRALGRVPAVLASGLVVVLLLAAVWALVVLPVVFVTAVGAGGAAVVVTVVFAVLLGAVVTAWIFGRLALASVLAAVGGHGLGIRRSWDLTDGHFWYVVGRLLIAGLIAGAASGVVNVVHGLGQFLGFAGFLAVVAVAQAVVSVATTIITVCAQVVTIDQVGS